MSKEIIQTKQTDSNDNEDKSIAKHKHWNYPELYNSFKSKQNRTCCSPVDDIEVKVNEDANYNTTNSVEVQTDKSTLFLLKQDKKIETCKKNVPDLNSKEFSDNKKIYLSNNQSTKQTNDLENIKVRKTGFIEHEKITAKIAAKISTPEIFDEYTETDLDQPMDYTLCYNETNLDDEKKETPSYSTKHEFPCVGETIEEEKVETTKPKGNFNKEPSKNKKEMFSNPSRSFKEIFNFFKDRDKKRSVESTKVSAVEGSKLTKNVDTYEQKIEKLSQPIQQPVEQCEKEVKSKNEAHCSQQTPLMFSRCSSLGSLNGFEQNSINDDRSSIISDFSRRTSGIVSPSELPDSPAQAASLSNKLQQKSQIGCFGKKKLQLVQQDKLKICQYSTVTNDNPHLQNEGGFKKPLIIKRSVFEDNITSFKDESTPTKLHSMAASSLSSLTIDDDDDYELISKMVLNKEKQITIEDSKSRNDRQEPIGESNVQNNSSVKLERNKIASNEDDNLNEEQADQLTDLTPYEEQLLDEYVRKGIAKWTKQNINEIKPFSWDVGLTCRATRSILASKIRVDSNINIHNNHIDLQNKNGKIITNNISKTKQNQNRVKENSIENHSLKDFNSIEPLSNLKETNDQFENSYYITYEEHLLDECIRRGMAKITKKNINDIKPFSWDANQICLTTRAMILHGRDENIRSNH